MTRIVVTGAAGFIGANIVKGLNARGIDDIIAVDDLTQGDKFRNLADLKIADYVDRDLFYDLFADGFFGKVEAVFHEGACSDTMESDGKYMMDNNYTLSCGLFHACQERGSRLLYASSAATYGGSATFRETPEFEGPLNVYGYSKQLFDDYVRRLPTPIVIRFARQQTGTVDFACSNVRGAPFDLWIAGAKVLANHPFGPTAGVAFNVTVLSYLDALDLGLNTDTGAITEPDVLRGCLADAAAGLYKLV